MPTSSLDIQHNGSHGLDFNNSDWTLDRIPSWLVAHARCGGGQILATIITADLPTMKERIRRILAAREAFPAFASVVPGLHLEGPFISPEIGYVGAHPQEDVIPANISALADLTETCQGLLKLVTLAPETDPGCQATAWLAKNGIAIAAGHTNASEDQLQAAIDQGLSLFTHLGNGCPAVLPRHDNIIQRAIKFARLGKLTPCFIPDGAHIPFFALANYLHGLGPCIMVTDAMTAAGMPPGTYTLGKSSIRVGPDLVARAPDGIHLAGSTLTMAKLRENLAKQLNFTEAAVLDCTDSLPRKLLGLGSIQIYGDAG